MKRAKMMIAGAIGAVVLAAGTAAAWYETPQSRFVGLCSQAMAKRLKAPSTYRLVAVDDYARTVTAYPHGEVINFSATVEYEAENPFGVPLRDSFACTLEHPGTKDIFLWPVWFPGEFYRVKINGIDFIDYEKRQILQTVYDYSGGH